MVILQPHVYCLHAHAALAPGSARNPPQHLEVPQRGLLCLLCLVQRALQLGQLALGCLGSGSGKAVRGSPSHRR